MVSPGRPFPCTWEIKAGPNLACTGQDSAAQLLTMRLPLQLLGLLLLCIPGEHRGDEEGKGGQAELLGPPSPCWFLFSGRVTQRKRGMGR